MQFSQINSCFLSYYISQEEGFDGAGIKMTG
jgi:hypothetical protein